MGKIKYIAKCIDCSTVVSRYAKRCKTCKVKAGKARKTCTCNKCGKEYVNKRSHGEEGTKYCSRECAYADNATAKRENVDANRDGIHSLIYFKICVICSNSYIGRNKRSSLCSDACKKKLNCLKEYNRNLSKKIILETRCKSCNELFVSEYGDKKKIFCSLSCSRKYDRRVGTAKRRATERSIEAENIDPFKVFDRDKWKCRLCGIKTPKTKRGSYMDTAPELDHIIPLSKGGKHIYSNVQCSCRKCNQMKGGKELGQLLLFG